MAKDKKYFEITDEFTFKTRVGETEGSEIRIYYPLSNWSTIGKFKKKYLREIPKDEYLEKVAKQSIKIVAYNGMPFKIN